MSIIGLNNRVEYFLLYNNIKHEVKELINWEDIDIDFERHPDYYGIFPVVSDSVIFTNSSAEFIRYAYDKEGVNANVNFIVRRKDNTIDNKWFTDFNGSLDLMRIKIEFDKISCNVHDNGIMNKLKVNMNKNININLNKDLYDKEVNTADTVDVLMHGRDVQILSEAVMDEDNEMYSTWAVHDGDGTKTFVIPTKKIIDNDMYFHSQVEKVFYPTTDNMSYVNSSGVNIDLNIDISTRFKIMVGDFVYNQAPTVGIGVKILKYSNFPLFNNMQTINLGHEEHSLPLNSNGLYMNFDLIVNENINISLADNESFTVVFYLTKFGCGWNVSVDYWHQPTDYLPYFKQGLNAVYFNMIINSQEETIETNSKAYLIYEFTKQMLKLIGINNFKSKLLGRLDVGYNGDGELSNTAIAHGLFIREFDINNNLFKPINTSVKKLLNSIDTVGCIGIGINKIGLKEELVLENRDFFFQKFVFLSIRNGEFISRTPFNEMYYNSLKIGYAKPSGDALYEEAFGLDEPNISTEYSSPIDSDLPIKNIISDFRTDTYGIEFARRKPFSEFPLDDTRYDKNVFMFDVKKNNNESFYRLKKWQDDFESAPSGVYSPDTIFNLKFSPAKLVFKHGKYLRASLFKNKNNKLKFIGSKGNSNMSNVINGTVIQENSDIKIKDLQLNSFNAEIVTIRYDINDSVIESIKGSTNNIPNMYGTIEFINEFRKKEKGYLWSLNMKNKEIKILVKW